MHRLQVNCENFPCQGKQTLDINWQKEESCNWAESLTKLRNLNKLCIYHKVEDTTRQEYGYIQKLSNLTTLSLVYFRRTIPFDSYFLCNMTKLKQLCIGNSVHLNDYSLAQIICLTNLEHLSIFSAAITDKGAEQISQLTKLTTLDISCNHNVTGVKILFSSDGKTTE